MAQFLAQAARTCRLARPRPTRPDFAMQKDSAFRGVGLGAGVGCCTGALIGFYQGTSIATHAIVGGGLGALTIGSYYATWRLLRPRSEVDNFGNHLISGSVTGYIITALTAGPKATNIGIICGGGIGIGIYHGLVQFEKWRVRTGVEMARSRLQTSSSNPASAAPSPHSDDQDNVPPAGSAGWYKWLPIRKISDEEAAAIIEDRKRVQDIRSLLISDSG